MGCYKGSCKTHETLVEKILEHGNTYQWIEEDIEYDFKYNGVTIHGQIDALGYRSNKNITIYEAKSNYTDRNYSKAQQQLGRAELMLRTLKEINGFPVHKNAKINLVYVSKQKIKRV